MGFMLANDFLSIDLPGSYGKCSKPISFPRVERDLALHCALNALSCAGAKKEKEEREKKRDTRRVYHVLLP